jgi:hypothetical protein
MNSASEVKFQIGHVLFIDIVGYSKLLINEQSEQIQKLKQIVCGTEEVRKAEARRENFCGYQQETAARSYFETVRKRRFCVRWRLVAN